MRPPRTGRKKRGSPSRPLALLSGAVAAALTLTGCAGAGELGGSGDKTQLTIAIVANPQMKDAIKLSPQFQRENPDIDLNFVTLPENEARAKITASVATGGGEYDVTMISNYEAPQWAENGWLANLTPHMNASPGYDAKDFIPTIHDSVSYQGGMYAAPFYGESSFLVYRKDLFAKAGLTMPPHPTWPQIAAFAKKLHDPARGQSGICMRGLPGWGEVLAPLDTVINTFGGRWFDPQWRAQLTSPEVKEAVNFYVKLLRESGQPGPAISGFSECVTNYSQGHSAMWYDATSMVSTTEDKANSTVVGKNGYVAAPVMRKPGSGWLYTWALAIPSTSEHKDAAWRFIRWMTNKQYLSTVGSQLGWARIPPGSRTSTYQIPQYAAIAKPYAGPTLDAMRTADQAKPTLQPVPYQGIQFVRIPEFQDLGTRVSQQIAAAIAGRTSVDDALDQAQKYATVVGDSYREG